MPSQNQKNKALEESVNIAKEYARGGATQYTPADILEQSYKMIVKIMTEIKSEAGK